MEAKQEALLDALYEQLENLTATHAGYPYNLSFEYERLAPFLKFSLNNLGDPYVDGNYVIGTKEIERNVIDYFGHLYRLDHPWGYITACGTEGNYYGIWLGTRQLRDAVVVASRDSHYSIGKAAEIAKTPLEYVESASNGEIDYGHLREITHSLCGPFVVNVNIGTTVTGAVDCVEKVSEVLEASGRAFHLHCDGALGGLLEPYLNPNSELNFSRYPIGSLSVSGHKFVGSPLPCGVVMARRELVKQVEKRIEYIGSVDTTIMGSRSGLAPLFIWQALETRDFAQEARECRRNAEYLWSELRKRGKKPLLNDFSTTVVFNKPSDALCRTWQLSTAGSRAHIVVMQNHTVEDLDRFLGELDDQSGDFLAAI